MASSSDIPSPTSTRSGHEGGDFELRFGNDREPLRVHRVFLEEASRTVLAPMIAAEDRKDLKASYLVCLLLRLN
eukprot:gene7451-591_t